MLQFKIGTCCARKRSLRNPHPKPLPAPGHRARRPGLRNSEVAEVIGTTEYVVKNHLRIIFDKLGFWNRVELALWYEARRHEGLAHEEPDRILV